MAWRWHESRSHGDANWNWNDWADNNPGWQVSRSRGDANWSGVDANWSGVAEAETTAEEETTAVAATVALGWVWSLKYFQSFQSFHHWTSNYKQHNIALKYLRERAEARQEDVVVSPFHFEGQEIAEITHDKGVTYHFSDTKFKRWYWQEMVAQLDEASMRLVVEGEDPVRSRGLVSCKLEKSDRYDHKRAHADPGGQHMYKTWDFILERDDGSKIALHPNYSSTEFECLHVLGPSYSDHEIPRTGLGGTSGPRTFKYFVGKHVKTTLRFDGGKQPQSRAGPQSRSQPASSSGATHAPQSGSQPASSSDTTHATKQVSFAVPQ